MEVKKLVGDILYEHERGRLACKCGWEPQYPDFPDVDHVDHQAQAVLDALSSAGFEVVQGGLSSCGGFW